MADNKMFRTPRGVARWPFLTKPYTQFKAEGEYKVTLELDPATEGVKELIAKCDKAVASMKAKNKPYTFDDEKKVYSFKFSSKYPPQIFDSHGVKVAGDLSIGSGTTMVCAVEAKPYDGFGGGLKFYLKAVQIIDLVEYSGSTADDFGFTAEEEGFSVGSFDDFPADAPAEVKKGGDFEW
jgi:hypothetical protein